VESHARISPFKRSASQTPSEDLPDAVGPTIATRGFEVAPLGTPDDRVDDIKNASNIAAKEISARQIPARLSPEFDCDRLSLALWQR
jgi:hypothetical protein